MVLQECKQVEIDNEGGIALRSWMNGEWMKGGKVDFCASKCGWGQF